MTGYYRDRDGYEWVAVPEIKVSCTACTFPPFPVAVAHCEELRQHICRSCFYELVYYDPKSPIDPRVIGKKIGNQREAKALESQAKMRDRARGLMRGYVT